MKNIGILTFCNANNYGAVLQSYALQKYLEGNKCNAEFINMNFNEKCEISNNNYVIEKKNLLDKYNAKLSRIKFKLFRKKYLKINENVICGDSESKKIKEYDYYIVGSDQVWNTDITNKTKAFFLNFTEKNKISYAASYGKSQINELEDAWSKEELKKFDKVSVREYSAYEYLKKQNCIDVKWVCDPVFLLDKNEWKKSFNLRNINTGKYILVYYMEPSKELSETIKYFEKKLNLKVKCICGGKGMIKEKYKHIGKKGPIEFLKEINNAELIITNSFHAAAFSMILEKKFVVIGHSKWNARLDSLLKVSNNENCFVHINDIKDFSSKIINGKIAYENMESHIIASKEFLKNSIA